MWAKLRALKIPFVFKELWLQALTSSDDWRRLLWRSARAYWRRRMWLQPLTSSALVLALKPI